MIELWKGLIFGIILSFIIGPVFFALIQTSIEKGFKAGAFMALGVSMSDSLYIFLTFSGVSKLTENIQLKFFLGMAGALIMIGFGLHSILKPIPKKGLNMDAMNSNSYLRKILKGFMLNSLNPFLWIFWLGVAGLVTIEMEYNFDQASLFYIGVIGMVLTMDIVKSYMATRLRMIITPHFMRIMNRGVGIVLILFGLRLIYYAFEIKSLI
ncbi:MAG: LysE family translocator [Cyclobacteriaceae bacterium]|nr:LysE family translocator [Cyclobacteriaceae bacterium]